MILEQTSERDTKPSWGNVAQKKTKQAEDPEGSAAREAGKPTAKDAG